MRRRNEKKKWRKVRKRHGKERRGWALCLIASSHYSIIIERLLDCIDKGDEMASNSWALPLWHLYPSSRYSQSLGHRVEFRRKMVLDQVFGKPWDILQGLLLDIFLSLHNHSDFRFQCRCFNPYLGSICVMGRVWETHLHQGIGIASSRCQILIMLVFDNHSCRILITIKAWNQRILE